MIVSFLWKFRLVFVGIALCAALWGFGQWRYSQGNADCQTVCDARIATLENEALKQSATRRKKRNAILLNRPARDAVIKRLRDGSFNPGV